jgi:hypothetical protein
MSLGRKSLLLLLGLVASISVAPAIDKGKKFTPPALDSISTKASSQGVTIGVIAFTTDEQAKTAFGKLNPYEHGVLPVLLVIRNDSKQAVRLNNAHFEYIDRDRSRIEPTPANEVPYANAPRRPTFSPNPIPIPGIGGRRKNPLTAEEIELRAWSAKMLPPGESAHGFLYFQTGHRGGARLYITGLQEAATGKELFFFDIPLD